MTTPDYRAALVDLLAAWDAQPLPAYQSASARAVARARALLAAPEAAPVPEDWFFEFEKWLVAQMPAGTVIGDPRWWAPRIARACTSRFTAAPEAVGVADEELVDTYRVAYSSAPVSSCEQRHVNGLRAVLIRYGSAHPAPVPVGERLPGDGEWIWHCYAGVRFWQHGIHCNGQFFIGNGPESQPATHWQHAAALPLPEAKP